MAEGISISSSKRYAVVTGANKGIGYGICRQLASQGIIVVLTARNEKRGLEAIEKLKGFDFFGNIVFHQLDVVDPSSISSLAEFIKIRFGRLDILPDGSHIDWNGIMTETYELAVECLQTNYYGAKRMIETFRPLLHLSDTPRIVNVSSSMGKLKYIPNQWAKGVLSDFGNLTEERVDDVVNEFFKDFKEGSLQAKGWPSYMSAYAVSKAAMNAYTRVLAKKHPTFCVNCVCPGFVKTDGNFNTGYLTVEEGAESPVRLALMPDDGTSGLFFVRNEVSSFD